MKGVEKFPAVRWIKDTVNLVDGGRVGGGYVVSFDILFGCDEEDEDDEGAGTGMMMSVLASMERAVTRR